MRPLYLFEEQALSTALHNALLVHGSRALRICNAHTNHREIWKFSSEFAIGIVLITANDIYVEYHLLYYAFISLVHVHLNDYKQNHAVSLRASLHHNRHYYRTYP